MKKKLSYRIIVPTYNAQPYLDKLISSLNKESLSQLYVVDSSSTDDTQKILDEYGIAYHVISTAQFNHGGTRQMVAERTDTDVLIYMTQDAYLASPNAIENILSCFEDADVGAVCGRQLPHKTASPLAHHARLFNYPKKTKVKDKSDIPELGIKVPFVSNSFTAYRRSALMEIGGFPSNTILSEDMYAAAKMVQAGYKIVYSAEATCYHSHNYTPIEEFKRYFDIGVFHARETWIRKTFGGAGGEGLRFINSELRHVWPNPYWIFRSCITSACKLLGYKLGQQEKRLPTWLKKKLSMHLRFWDNPA